jgi:hypothetical protein
MRYFGLAGGVISAVVAIVHAVYYAPTTKYVSLFDPNWTSTFG